MEKDSQVNLKIKPETTLKALDDMLEAQKFNLYCSDVIKAYKDLIKARFGAAEVDTIVFEYSKGTQHLKIRDTKTNDTFTTSCHAGGKHGKYNPKMINFLIDMMGNSIVYREKEKTKTSESNKWIKYAPKWKIVDEDKEAIVEAKSKSKSNHGGLDDWFKKEKWVDVSRPKKGGGFEACGRGDTSKGKKPVCTPANKAKNLTDKERKNRIRQKRNKEKEPNPDKKPNVTTYSPGAGGKSNVSNSHISRFVESMIPLSELRPEQPKFIKISGIEDEGGIGSENPNNPLDEMGYDTNETTFDQLDQMGYEKRSSGEEISPEEEEKWKPWFINIYFQVYQKMVKQILTPMYEDSKYKSIHDFRPALNRKEPEAVKLFLDANRYLAGTSKSRGGSVVAQIFAYKLAAQAKLFIDNDIDIFNFPDREGPDISAAWHLVKTYAFADENIEEED